MPASDTRAAQMGPRARRVFFVSVAEKLARRLGVSCERVRQVEKQGLARVRRLARRRARGIAA